jgi:hypothetical protein
MDTPTRIISYLQTHSTATVDQLRYALNFTKPAIHYHIRQLLATGKIVVSPIPYQNGAGRPARVFELAKPVPAPLSEVLLREISKKMVSLIITDRELEVLCAEIAAKFLTVNPDAGSSAVLLAELTLELEQSGFILRWQASPGGADIRLSNEYLSALLPDEKLAQGILNALITAIQQKIA